MLSELMVGVAPWTTVVRIVAKKMENSTVYAERAQTLGYARFEEWGPTTLSSIPEELLDVNHRCACRILSQQAKDESKLVHSICSSPHLGKIQLLITGMVIENNFSSDLILLCLLT
jgi:hypothetical protein